MNCSYFISFLLLELIQLVFSKITQDANLLTIPSEDDTKEPSCDELRKMWRHTKREMQQKTEVPSQQYKARYHEPFSYGWKTQARPRNAMYSKPVYGRVVHSPDKFLYRNNIPSRFRSYDQVARMVGSPGYYPAPQLATPQKTTFFRLDYPVRRPVVPVRITHIGRFQELQNVLRNERADELQSLKLKGSSENTEKTNSEFTDDSMRSYNTYPFSQSNDDDATAVNSKGRKLRGTDGSETDVDSDNSESREESDSLQSTSKPVLPDENIPRRWALGEWKR